MTFRYRVNLVADRIERRKMRADLLQAITISLGVLLVMLLATCAAHAFRNRQIAHDRDVTNLLAAKIGRAGISPSEVGALQQENQELVTLLGGIGRLVKSSEPWSAILIDLETCCRAGRAKIRRVRAVENAQGAVALHVEALSQRENPIADVHDFIRATGDHARFQVGSLRSVENEKGESTFHVEVPLGHEPADAEGEPAENQT